MVGLFLYTLEKLFISIVLVLYLLSLGKFYDHSVFVKFLENIILEKCSWPLPFQRTKVEIANALIPVHRNNNSSTFPINCSLIFPDLKQVPIYCWVDRVFVGGLPGTGLNLQSSSDLLHLDKITQASCYSTICTSLYIRPDTGFNLQPSGELLHLDQITLATLPWQLSLYNILVAILSHKHISF